MADLTLSEFHEIRRRQSLEDFRLLLTLLERDEEIVLVDDPEPESEEEEEDEELDDTDHEGLSPEDESQPVELGGELGALAALELPSSEEAPVAQVEQPASEDVAAPAADAPESPADVPAAEPEHLVSQSPSSDEQS